MMTTSIPTSYMRTPTTLPRTMLPRTRIIITITGTLSFQLYAVYMQSFPPPRRRTSFLVPGQFRPCSLQERKMHSLSRIEGVLQNKHPQRCLSRTPGRRIKPLVVSFAFEKSPPFRSWCSDFESRAQVLGMGAIGHGLETESTELTFGTAGVQELLLACNITSLSILPVTRKCVQHLRSLSETKSL